MISNPVKGKTEMKKSALNIKYFALFSLFVIFALSAAALAGQPVDAGFLSEWKLFLYVDETKVNYADLRTIPRFLPAEGNGVANPITVKSNEEGLIDLEALAGGFHTKACAILFTEITVDAPVKVNVGTSPDWWMEWRVNGTPLMSTLDFGCDRYYMRRDRNKLLDFVIELPLKKGKNLIAVKVLAGSRAWNFHVGQDEDVRKAKPTPYKAVSDYMDRPMEFTHNEATVPAYTLPELLTTRVGQKVADVKTWENTRRQEILDDLNRSIYGAIPQTFDHIDYTVKKVEECLDGLAIRKNIDINIQNAGKTLTFPVTLFVPKTTARPAPVFLIIHRKSFRDGNFDYEDPYWPVKRIVENGFATISFDRNSLSPDNKENYKKGILALYPGQTEKPDGWRTISAWAYGAMRCVDYLLTDPAIDQNNIAVIGHSRCGKAALWAAANDPRIAMACINNSGCTGAALSRRKTGQTLWNINFYTPYWFNENYHACKDENDLPVDQHMPIALIAPRYICIGESLGDPVADPKGAYQALLAADSVFALYGKKKMADEVSPILNEPVFGDGREFHIKYGNHSLTEFDWDQYMEAAERFFQ